MTAPRIAIAAGLAGFCAGAFTLAMLVWQYGNFVGSRVDRARLGVERAPATDRWIAGIEPHDGAPAVLEPHVEGTGGPAKAGPDVSPKAAPHASTPSEAKPDTAIVEPRIGANPIGELRDRKLGMPVEGVDRSVLIRSYEDRRGASRRHEAIDIMAPRDTPVVAVDDGIIARLFLSEAGGLTVYQYDPSRRFIYYYAHLERYAAGLEEGDEVRRGQVIGYVGTSGNAPKSTPHLHFAIFRAAHPDRWWEGTPLDPYEILR